MPTTATAKPRDWADEVSDEEDVLNDMIAEMGILPSIDAEQRTDPATQSSDTAHGSEANTLCVTNTAIPGVLSHPVESAADDETASEDPEELAKMRAECLSIPVAKAEGSYSRAKEEATKLRKLVQESAGTEYAAYASADASSASGKLKVARLLNARLEDIVDETAMQFLSGCGDALGSTKHVANVAKRVEDLYERLSDTLTECTERQLRLAGRVLHSRDELEKKVGDLVEAGSRQWVRHDRHLESIESAIGLIASPKTPADQSSMTARFRRPKCVTADSEHYPAYLQTLCDTLTEGLQVAPDPDAGTGNEATDDDNLALRTAHQIFAASHLGQMTETLRLDESDLIRPGFRRRVLARFAHELSEISKSDTPPEATDEAIKGQDMVQNVLNDPMERAEIAALPHGHSQGSQDTMQKVATILRRSASTVSQAAYYLANIAPFSLADVSNQAQILAKVHANAIERLTRRTRVGTPSAEEQMLYNLGASMKMTGLLNSQLRKYMQPANADWAQMYTQLGDLLSIQSVLTRKDGMSLLNECQSPTRIEVGDPEYSAYAGQVLTILKSGLELHQRLEGKGATPTAVQSAQLQAHVAFALTQRQTLWPEHSETNDILGKDVEELASHLEDYLASAPQSADSEGGAAHE